MMTVNRAAATVLIVVACVTAQHIRETKASGLDFDDGKRQYFDSLGGLALGKRSKAESPAEIIDDLVGIVDALNIKVAELKNRHKFSGKRMVFDRFQGGGDFLL